MNSMPKPFIKICGLTSVADVQMVTAAGADLVGLIFAPASPRRVDSDTAKSLAAVIHQASKQVVAVFMDQPLEEVQAIAKLIKADYVQLHGQESPEYCQAVGLPIIKALKPLELDEETLANFRRYQPVVKYFLLDRPQQGSGAAVSLALVVSLAQEFAIILAGGLNPATIGEASSRTSQVVQGYDVASGVESAPGVKDEAKVRTFINIIRG